MEISDINKGFRYLQFWHIATLNLTEQPYKMPVPEDDKPSCRVYTETNTFHCFGYGATGDQIEFIEKYEKCSKHEAILKAKQHPDVKKTHCSYFSMTWNTSASLHFFIDKLQDGLSSFVGIILVSLLGR
ncbi:MAG: hypothetical protein KJ578_13000 [Bacteroidetes bacterium]|nr:hypothetical protein [Bacteroidota bacterium]MBU1579980.1 hypothetical protein [Bacteroidota bacterium]MBU2465326.1 hypothetical protein [Bacteroidota bacterium]MBU2558687.1 hypothetical protein [Bacteroidota bacterium]